MCTPRRTISLGFDDSPVLEGQHICYLFNDDKERLRVISKYLEQGLLDHEKLLYLVDVMTPDEMLDALDELGIDARNKKGDCQIAEAAPAYCPSGSFNSEDMLDIVKRFYTNATEQGYVGARGTGEMSWCIKNDTVDMQELMTYESRLTGVLEQYPYTACCQYDVRKFNGDVIMDVLSVHPYMIVHGQLVENPYYVESETFLARFNH